eukprot:tig00000342_g24227.t1
MGIRLLQAFISRSQELYFKRTPSAGRLVCSCPSPDPRFTLQPPWPLPPAIVTCRRSPQIQELAKAGEHIRNDHIAFRTFGSKGLGIAAMEPVILDSGYQRMDELHFKDKHLRAFWYKPPQPEMTRIFISEIIVPELSSKSQLILDKYLKEADVATSRYAILSSVLEARPWPTPTLADYEALNAESEYASWTLVNAYAFNHITVAVHLMRQYNSLEKLSAFLKEKGFLLNNSAGEIKTSEDGLLKQSSTVADKVSMRFAGGEERVIPGSYIEFAERLVLPKFARIAPADIREEHRRDGFEVANADKIFESTYQSQAFRK